MRYLRAFRLAFAFAALSISVSAPASGSELFVKGPETFKFQDAKGETPTFRVLTDSMSKRALAIGVITLINSEKSVHPKMPITDYVDLKFQTLRIEPVLKSPDKLQMTLKISGYPIDIDQTIIRKDFLSGQLIEVRYPKKSRDVMMYNVETDGNMAMKWDMKADVLIFNEVRAKLSFDPPMSMGDSETESVKFSGIGKRLK